MENRLATTVATSPVRIEIGLWAAKTVPMIPRSTSWAETVASSPIWIEIGLLVC